MGVWGYVTFFGSVFLAKAPDDDAWAIFIACSGVVVFQIILFLISQRAVTRFTRDMLFATQAKYALSLRKLSARVPVPGSVLTCSYVSQLGQSI